MDKPKTKMKAMPLWFKAVCGLTLLALIAVTVGILCTESWVDVVTQQIHAIQNHDIDKAYDKYTSTAFQRETTREEFEAFINFYPAFLEVESAFFTKRSIADNVRTLRGYLLLHNHKTLPIEYRVIKEDGSWKIQSIRLLKTRKLIHQKSEVTN